MRFDFENNLVLDKGAIKVFSATFVPDSDDSVVVSVEGIDGAICYNCYGVDFLGKPFIKAVAVQKGKEKKFWFAITSNAQNLGSQQGKIKIVDGKGTVLVEGGIVVNFTDKVCTDPFEDIYSLNRLVWINSDLAIDGTVTKPYIPVNTDGETL